MSIRRRLNWIVGMPLIVLLSWLAMLDNVGAQDEGARGGSSAAIECATVSPGSGETANGSLFNLGQALTGTSASRTQTISFGVIQCLTAGPQTPAGCLTTCGDLDGSGGPVNLQDFATFALCFNKNGPGGSCPDPVTFACADLNGDGSTNLVDFATFSLVFGKTSSNAPPDCP